MRGFDKAAEFDDYLFERINAVVQPGDEIATLSNKKPNRVVAIDRNGVRVATLRSDERGIGAQLVPAWMITAAWRRLQQQGHLSQTEVLEDLNVKRSAFVCALLAVFSDVVVRSTRPTVLELLRR